MTYERPSPQDYEYESDYIEALERWQDYQNLKAELADHPFEGDDDSNKDS